MKMRFRHERVDENPPCARLGFCLTTDLTGNGRDDVIIGGAGSSYKGKRFVRQVKESGFPMPAKLRNRLGLEEVHLFWYENPGWDRHKIAVAPGLDVGATLGDVTGNGRTDIVAGQGIGQHDVYWFEQPTDPRGTWKRYLITNDFEKYHDLEFSDVDDDGEPEIVGLSQESEVIFYYDVPDDPYESPWPAENRHIVAEQTEVEGVRIIDIDDDGRTEILAGTSIYDRPAEPGQSWNREDVVTGWDDTRVTVADLDEDGDLEVIYSEGDSPHLGTHPGRVAWFDPPDWEGTILEDDLYCPHSLQVADFTGNGLPDIYVGEMGLGTNEKPKHIVFANHGEGAFEKHVIANGVPTHEAKAVDLTGDGRPDIVGKSYGPDHHVDVWYNEGDSA